MVYRTLPQKNFAVHDLASGRVSCCDEFRLADASFEVSEAGEPLTVRKPRRMTLAGVVGQLLEHAPRDRRCDLPLRYDPTRRLFLVTQEQVKIHMAKDVHLVNGRERTRRRQNHLM